MKRIACLLIMAFAVCAVPLAAQGVEKKVTAYKNVSRDQVPAAVVTSMEEDFPGLAVQGYGVLPVALYREEWEVWEETNTPQDADMVYYTVEFSGEDIKGRAVYDGEGRLMKFHETIKDAPLPEPVAKAIATNYPGWTILGDKEFINHMEAGMAIYYKVKVRKGNRTKTLAYDTSGFLLWDN